MLCLITVTKQINKTQCACFFMLENKNILVGELKKRVVAIFLMIRGATLIFLLTQITGPVNCIFDRCDCLNNKLLTVIQLYVSKDSQNKPQKLDNLQTFCIYKAVEVQYPGYILSDKQYFRNSVHVFKDRILSI